MTYLILRAVPCDFRESRSVDEMKGDASLSDTDRNNPPSSEGRTTAVSRVSGRTGSRDAANVESPGSTPGSRSIEALLRDRDEWYLPDDGREYLYFYKEGPNGA